MTAYADRILQVLVHLEESHKTEATKKKKRKRKRKKTKQKLGISPLGSRQIHFILRSHMCLLLSLEFKRIVKKSVYPENRERKGSV
jgi:hypothetical protein